ETVLPWEVKTGSNVTGLDAKIKKGQSEVDIVASKAIPVLGIRTIEQTFPGQPGISPQISYGDAVDVDAFENGRAPLTLEVKGADDSKIGTLTTSMGASALISIKNVNDGWSGYNLNYSSQEGQGFFGGLPKELARVASEDIAINVMPEVAEKYTDQGVADAGNIGVASTFDNVDAIYSGYYGAGIEQGKTIKITLDTPAESDAITWKASLPVVVSYQ
ncbi:F4 family fimbrial subunit, partial [Escherichia coli]|uniref:F4 family fimbrial subunit n=1 Tax=Escherichia coli TaxID=562 RepID=UPI001C384805